MPYFAKGFLERLVGGWHYDKGLLFLICLVPLGWIFYHGLTDQLGANPIEEITHRTGIWALRLLLVTLTITPFRQILGWQGLLRFRRMLGLFAFFYACLHFGTYLVLDQYFDWPSILEDIAKRPYITVGFLALLLLIPLAVTSTKSIMRKLGRRWGRLHQLIYLITLLGCLHFLWLVKADLLEPILYLTTLILLLGYRAGRKRRQSISR